MTKFESVYASKFDPSQWLVFFVQETILANPVKRKFSWARLYWVQNTRRNKITRCHILLLFAVSLFLFPTLHRPRVDVFVRVYFSRAYQWNRSCRHTPCTALSPCRQQQLCTFSVICISDWGSSDCAKGNILYIAHVLQVNILCWKFVFSVS